MALASQSPPCLQVSDLDASRAFYQTVFGASVTWDEHVAGVRMPGGMLLRLVGQAPPPGQPFDAAAVMRARTPDPQHIRLHVSMKSLGALQRVLLESGVPIEQRGGSDATICVRDLDGHVLELALTSQQGGQPV